MALDMNNFSTDMTEKEAVYSDKKLRIGIIGTGGIAHSHIRAYQHQPDVEIVAACDLIPGKAEKFLKEYNVEAPTFEDYKQMIDTVPMDAVSVCVYNRNHAVCTIYALEHGVNVLLEKPMTVTLDEAVAICKRRKEERQDRFPSASSPVCDANMKMIKKIVESGELGRHLLHPDRRRPSPRHSGPGQHLHRERQRPVSAPWATSAATRWIWC